LIPAGSFRCFRKMFEYGFLPGRFTGFDVKGVRSEEIAIDPGYLIAA